MTDRELTTTFSLEKADKSYKTSQSKPLSRPDVFLSPLRPDLVSFVHEQLRRNKRQAHGVSTKAGVQCSALSWGTGRAVARIPRVKGGGTHRSGQAAYGNMVRGGHVFNPLVTYRRWHRRVNIRQRRHAVASAVAATSIPSLVSARGHEISSVPEFPLVIRDDFVTTSAAADSFKTKEAVEVLKAIGAYDDVLKVKDSKRVRPGKGKMRNRRYIMKKGPLIVHDLPKDSPFVMAFRNIIGVELMHVERMNIHKLAPGGHLGRFVIWTSSAYEKLSAVFGTKDQLSQLKKGYILPRSMVTSSDVSSLINSQPIQSVLRPIKEKPRKAGKKINPFNNAHVMHKLNPYARVLRRKAILQSQPL